MKLSKLCEGIECRIQNNNDVEITSVEYDSRRVEDGSLFFCIQGLKQDGHQFADIAVRMGARALMVSRVLDIGVPQIVVGNDRECMAKLAANFYGNPSKRMKMIGITGTNGKTTTGFLISSIVKAAGFKPGLISTVSNYIDDTVLPTEKTTPESPDLQRLLKRMADEDIKICTMEVSSHSLSMSRVNSIQYDVGVFTNLTQDHLDYHKSIENYRGAKKRLFAQSSYAVTNVDDGQSAFMLNDIFCPHLTFGIENECDVKAHDIDINSAGVAFTITSQFGECEIDLKIPGMFSVYNALAAASACFALGFSAEQVKTGLEAVDGVPGRVDTISADEGYSVIIDYAHTPDGLENVLKMIKAFVSRRIITVFGCGGDRDKGKRSIMGAIAEAYSDFCVVTSDNPRSEQPMEIIKDILKGIKGSEEKYVVIENRREAIAFALDKAREGDVVLIAGKGHETYQEIAGVKYPFDEKLIVGELLNSPKGEHKE